MHRSWRPECRGRALAGPAWRKCRQPAHFTRAAWGWGSNDQPAQPPCWELGSHLPGCPQSQKGLSLTPIPPKRNSRSFLQKIRRPPSWGLTTGASANVLTKIVQIHATHWPPGVHSSPLHAFVAPVVVVQDIGTPVRGYFSQRDPGLSIPRSKCRDFLPCVLLLMQ